MSRHRLSIVIASALALLLAGCASGTLPPLERTAAVASSEEDSLRYLIVCLIHGDGDYLYHDAEGGEHLADDDAVERAKRVGRENPEAEVFIFHEMPKTHFLFFFPRADGEYFYYRGGRLLENERYRRSDEKEDAFEPEVRIYRALHRGSAHRLTRLFLYFGHEIPESDGTGYDRSHAERAFTIDTLERAMRHFAKDASKFDLAILGVCFGGTPLTIQTIGREARYIVASPDDLHLSYFDLTPLEHLEGRLTKDDIRKFALEFARNAFTRLSARVQTVVSVALYDVERAQKYLRSVQTRYREALGRRSASGAGNAQRCDCAEDSSFAQASMSEGVEVLYRAPRFGRQAQKHAHSGWECWKRE